MKVIKRTKACILKVQFMKQLQKSAAQLVKVRQNAYMEPITQTQQNVFKPIGVFRYLNAKMKIV